MGAATEVTELVPLDMSEDDGGGAVRIQEQAKRNLSEWKESSNER